MKPTMRSLGLMTVIIAALAPCVRAQSNSDTNLKERLHASTHQILFESYVDNNWELFVMNADGTAVTQITDDEESGWWPVWSPGNG